MGTWDVVMPCSLGDQMDVVMGGGSGTSQSQGDKVAMGDGYMGWDMQVCPHVKAQGRRGTRGQGDGTWGRGHTSKPRGQRGQKGTVGHRDEAVGHEEMSMGHEEVAMGTQWWDRGTPGDTTCL